MLRSTSEKWFLLMNERRRGFLSDLGALTLRLLGGFYIAFGHGYQKLATYGENLHTFADPIGMGPEVSLTLAVFAEFFCGLAIMLGFLTRLSAIPLIITFLVAAFLVHGADPWFMANAAGGGNKEPALLYLIIFLAVFFIGPGRLSLDALMSNRVKRIQSKE